MLWRKTYEKQRRSCAAIVVLPMLIAAPLACASLQESATSSHSRPNIVLMFPDNIGIGEVNAYGGVRGVLTPNIDSIAEEGIRLTNFNVQKYCIVSRIALMTGRYAVRTGESTILELPLREVTIAEGLRSIGYATGLFGKWHLGGDDWKDRNEPTHQGFEEWWGIPETSHTAQFTSFEGFDPAQHDTPYIWRRSVGESLHRVKVYDLEARRTVDREAAEQGIAFMERSVRDGKPFFFFYPMTQIHLPALPHPDFAGSTPGGDIGDSMADVDHNVGLVLTAIQRLGIETNTLVLWCTDGGAERRRPWRGSAGPWGGYYGTVMEGGIRVPCVIRWPGRIPAGTVSDDIVHEVDLFPTIAAAAGMPGIVPTDRPIDGVDQLPFLEGRQPNSSRESAMFFARDGKVQAVKWRNWKLWYSFEIAELPNSDPSNLLRLFDLGVDPREEFDVADFYPWIISVMDGIVADYEATLAPAHGSEVQVRSYVRADRMTLGPRSNALANPDFSGTWTAVLPTADSGGPPSPALVPHLGSGWGDKISIDHDAEELTVERVLFEPRDLQPPVRYHYSLDGVETKNVVNVGRTGRAPVSTTDWDGDRLVITTRYPFQNPANGRWLSSDVTQTLWLQAAHGTPFEPTLVVDTTRAGALGGPASTTRTVYNKGYR